MYIIKRQTNDFGARPALQTWDSNTLPEEYVFCPDKFVEVFYSTTPAGFVNIIIENNIVTFMEVNQEALDAYIASLPDPEEPAAEPDMYDELAAAIREGVNEI